MKSELVKTKVDIIERPKYSADEELYIKALTERISSASEQRDQSFDEWDGMDYNTQYEANERAANTFVAPKKNKEDTNFQSGTVRQKLFALLSAITNLNLSGDISAYDKDGLEVQALGDAMEDIILKVNEMDGDEEKKFIRHYELLKQGTVFVEARWDEKTKVVKKMTKAFNGKLKGNDAAKWSEKIEAAFARPSRDVIPGKNVYLGDITKYDISEQPFIFTVDVKPYEEAKAIFGEWDRWENVPRSITQFAENDTEGGYTYNWRLMKDLKNDQVEIVRYQDKWGNEFAVLLNGVLMTPIGLPLPFGLDEYNIAQQNLEPIHAKFAYGKSLVARIKNKVAILDEMQRLGVLKTQKSFLPVWLNFSGRTLTRRAFMPGSIIHGIPKDSLAPLHDKEIQGVTNSELAMIKEIQTSIDSETTSPLFSGQPSGGSATATEIVELQRQAKMVLGLTVFSISMLEWKLEWLYLKIVIANWFDADDKEARIIGVERQIEGFGMGRRIIIPTKEVPPPEAIQQVEDALSVEQNMPIRLVFLDPSKLNLAKLYWQITVRPKEKKSSEVEKLLFRAEMQDAQLFGQLINWDYLSERFASVWNENPQKMFKKQAQVLQEQQQSATMEEGMSPRQSLPTAEKALGKQVQASMGTL